MVNKIRNLAWSRNEKEELQFESEQDNHPISKNNEENWHMHNSELLITLY